MVFTAFANGESRISDLMTSWADKFISPERTAFFPDGIKIMQEVYLPINPEWWKQKIANRFDKVCQKIDEVTAGFIWTLWTAAPELIQHTKIATENEVLLYTQRKLVKYNTFYRELTTYSVSKKWYSMHAESISFELSPGDAIMAQLKFDKSNELEKHLDIIRINITDPIFFKECTTIDNKTIHEMAAKILNSTPSLFSDVNVRNLNWQKIWHESYLISGDITVGGNQSQKYSLK